MKKRRSRLFTNKKVTVLAIAALLVVGVVVAYTATRTTKPTVSPPASQPTTIAHSAAQSGEAPDTVVPNPQPNPNPNVPGGPGNGSGSSANTAILAPSGNFFSKSKAGLNDQEQSTCNSTPGASCTITFTKESVTKSLPSEVVNDSAKESQVAFATWDWTPANLGLSSGNWTVTAIASLNSQSKSTVSGVNLQVVQ